MPDLPPRLTWHVHEDGIHVWRDGKFVGVIPRDELLRVMRKVAETLDR